MTGSGKTEVYIRAIKEVVEYGRQAIVLVPEISLTPQTIRRFRQRFERVAVLHSHLSDAERGKHWRDIAAGKVEVVVGARSAIFAPTPHLGLVIIDEEHESTFKQDSVPRYHAREVAEQRCRAAGVPLVLGSATPTLESWHAAQEGRLQADFAAPSGRPVAAAAGGDGGHPQRPAGAEGAGDRPAAVERRDDRTVGRRAGDPVPEPAGVQPGGLVPGLRGQPEVSRLRRVRSPGTGTRGGPSVTVASTSRPCRGPVPGAGRTS